MKKQFLNLGKALSKTEQKEIFGGLHELKVYDPYCSTPDAPNPPGCGCSSSSDCAYTGPINTSWSPSQYDAQRGTCTAGICH